MKHATKADLAARAARLEKENTLLSYGLSALASGDKPTHVEKWRDPNDRDARYEAALYYPTAPHGGFVIVRFRYPGQRDALSVSYAEEWSTEFARQSCSLGDYGRAECAYRIARAARVAWAAMREGSSAAPSA